MSTTGDASQFKEADYLDDFIPEIIQLVVNTWQKFRHRRPSDLEVPISKWFVVNLRKEKERLKEKEPLYDFPFKIRPEILELYVSDSNAGKTKGRIDIIFDFTYTTKEEIYFAFECKRLRIQYNSKITANTSEYVGSDGMMCFITEQYSKDLSSGGMIGYVMDGKITLAIQSVKNAIDKKQVKLCMVSESSLSASSMLPDEQSIKETIHEISKKRFTIHHIFLAV